MATGLSSISISSVRIDFPNVEDAMDHYCLQYNEDGLYIKRMYIGLELHADYAKIERTDTRCGKNGEFTPNEFTLGI